MPDFSQIITRLIERLHQHTEPRQLQLRESLQFPASFCLISWLEAQTIYPKCYWQSRDGESEVVALAEACRFDDPSDAYQVINHDQKVWGGEAFDSAQRKDTEQASFFFLPQIELMRVGSEWTLAVNVNQGVADVIESLLLLQTEIQTLEPLITQKGEWCFKPDFQQWHSVLNKALDEISSDSLKKVVLARETRLTVPNKVLAAQLLKESMKQNTDCFHFLFMLSSDKAFIGSTPERLYHRQGNQINTEALAGTIGRSLNQQQDEQLAQWLLSDQKNIHENQLVVDDIIDRLTPYLDAIDVEPEAKLLTLRRVQHLKRSICGRLADNIKGVQMLSVLQPTAAIAGLPRQSALEFIRNNEAFVRGWYSGSLGYFGHDEAEFCVAIRSALVEEHQISFYAGAGIVAGSDADLEWQELNRKTATLFNLVCDFPIEDLKGASE